jgi:hypothetical protein
MVDSYPYSTGVTDEDIASIGVRADVLAGYIGVMDPAKPVGAVLRGLAFHPVTLAKEYSDGADDEIRWLKEAALPTGIHVSLDLEGPDTLDKPGLVIEQVTAWCRKIAEAGFIPSLYVGSPQPLTSDELWKLPAKLYWRGQGSTRDRFNKLAEPTRCGFAVTQVWPSTRLGRCDVDFNIIGQDYLGRSLVVACT